MVVIDLDDGTKTVARVLHPPLCEFYDARLAESEEVEVAGLLGNEILFRLSVMNSAFRRWRQVAHLPLSAEEQSKRHVFFKQDPINGRFTLYWEADGRAHTEPATFDDCVGLERAAVWDAEHVEDRLRDHFAGVANKWEISLRPRPPA